MADLKKGYEIEGDRIEQMSEERSAILALAQAAIKNPRK